MNLDLENKVVLITASAQGLGKGIAKEFLTEGARVIITDIDQEKLNSTLDEFHQEFGSRKCFGYLGDFTDQVTIQLCIKESVSFFGNIDILIANMGSGRGKPEWNISNEDWQKMIDLNFEGARKITNEVVPVFINNRSGAIIYISSIAGVEVIGAPIHYSVAKSSLIAYSKNLSFKLAQHGIRVNVVCPGNIFFEKGTWDIKMRENKNQVIEMLNNKVPQNRFAAPQDIANLVLFLASDKASFITGAKIIIDGGQTLGI